MDIKIRLYDEVPTEEFIRMVADKEILLTVADSNIALLNRRYYPEVKVAFPLEEPQSLGWAVRKGNESLLRAMNRFFEESRKDGTLARIYDTYYGNVEIFDYFDLRKYHKRLKSRLPKYRDMIKKASKKAGSTGGSSPPWSTRNPTSTRRPAVKPAWKGSCSSPGSRPRSSVWTG